MELPYNSKIAGLTHFVRGGDIVDVGDDDSGGGIGGDDIYIERMEPVLVLFFDLYSDDKISISGSRLSFCPAYTFY